jgi:NADH dehydrogenase FAD-containing subunit
MTSTKTTVVIIGASFAGAPIAHSLLKDVKTVKVILINPSPTFYFCIAAPRIMAKPTTLQPEQYLIPIESAFKKYPSDSFQFVQGRATGIDPENKSVTVDSQTTIPFDYLVIATGSTTASTIRNEIPIPFKQSNADNMETLIKNAQQAILSSSQIVIAGAGPIGVELAGELAEAAQQQGKSLKITLIEASDRVLPMLKNSSSKAAESLLMQKRVTIILGHTVTEALLSDGTWNISLSNGQQLAADLYIPTTGVQPNNNFIPQQWLDTDGWVKVDRELRVQGGQDASLPIYAAGDITNNSMRLSFKAAEQAGVVAANIKNDILGKGKRRVYDQGESIMMMVPVGGSAGTGQLFGMTPWSFLVKSIKGKDFFVSKAPSFIGAS